MLGLGDVERVCHEAENLVGNAPLESVTEGLLSVKDWLMQSFNSWAGKGNAPEGVEEFLVRIRDHAAPQAAGLEQGQGAEAGGNRAGKKEQAIETVAEDGEPPAEKAPGKQDKTEKDKAKPAPAPVAKAAPAKPAPAPEAPKPAAKAEPAPAPHAPAAGGGAAALYAAKGCPACHGPDGRKTLLPVYPKIAGLPVQYAVNQMKDIKSGARSNGQSAAMKGIVMGVDDNDLKAIAEWLATQ